MSELRQYATRDKKGVQRGRSLSLKFPLNEQQVIDRLADESMHSVAGTVRKYMLEGLKACGINIPDQPVD